MSNDITVVGLRCNFTFINNAVIFNFNNIVFFDFSCFKSFKSIIFCFKCALCRDFRRFCFFKNFFVFSYCKIIATENHVLCRNCNRFTVLRFKQVVCRKHQETCFCLCFGRKGYVHSHLVTVEVGVERCTNKRMKSYCTTFNKHRFKRLDTKAVKCRCTVQ